MQYGNPETGVVEIPMVVTVPDQSLPVRYIFRTQLTSGAVVIDPPALDFGTASCEEAVAMQVKLTNTSALPQQLGFVRLRAEVTVDPLDGFIDLLPGESTVVTVSFAPRSATDYRFEVCMKSMFNDIYSVPCRAAGVFPPLSVATPSVKFAACAEGGRVSETILLRNTGKSAQEFEFAPDPATNVSLAPRAGLLVPGERRRVTVEFRAPDPEPEAAGTEDGGGVVPVVGGGGSAAAAAAEEASKWSVHNTTLIPCYYREPPEEGKREKTGTLYVEAATTVVRPIVADDDGMVYRELDFGQVGTR